MVKSNNCKMVITFLIDFTLTLIIKSWFSMLLWDCAKLQTLWFTPMLISNRWPWENTKKYLDVTVTLWQDEASISTHRNKKQHCLGHENLSLVYHRSCQKINQLPYNRSLNLPFHKTRQTEAAIRCSYNLITFDVWTYAFSKFQISNWMCLISNELLWPDCKCQMHCCQICPDLNKDFSQKYFLMFLNWNDVTSLNSYLTSSTWFNVVLIFIFSTESLLTK